MIPINRSSSTHIALLYLKMKNNWVNPNNLLKLSPTKYEYEYIAKRSLEKLVVQGFASSQNNMYHITPNGIQACFRIPQEQKKLSYED